MHILLAEDNPVNRALVNAMLDKLGHTCTEARDGNEAIRQLEGGPQFDAILMDIQMPECDGVSATEEIRRRWVNDEERPYIIALTANARPEDRKACLAAGMDDFITKPLTLAPLKQALATAAEADSKAAENRGEIIDQEQFEMITDVGDKESIDTFWLFGDALQKATARLEELTTCGDDEGFRLLAYEQKSNAATFGLTALGREFSRLEKLALSGTEGFPEGWRQDLESLISKSLKAAGVPPKSP